MFRAKKATAVLALIILAITGSFLNTSTAQATSNYIEGTDEAAVMFDPLMVNDFSLEMSDADFESLKTLGGLDTWPH